MALADITAKIEADAKQQAEEHRTKAQEQIRSLKTATEREIQEMETSFQDRFQKERPEILRRRETVAKLDVRREKLNARRAAIARCFDEALRSLLSQDRDTVARLMESLLLEGAETGDETVHVGPKEQVLDEAWLQDFNVRHGKRHTLHPERDVRIQGGFFLARERVQTNCTWGMLLQTFQEDREADVVKQLFAND